MNVHLQFGIKQCDCLSFEEKKGSAGSQRVEVSRHLWARSCPSASRGWERPGWFKELEGAVRWPVVRWQVPGARESRGRELGNVLEDGVFPSGTPESVGRVCT